MCVRVISLAHFIRQCTSACMFFFERCWQNPSLCQATSFLSAAASMCHHSHNIPQRRHFRAIIHEQKLHSSHLTEQTRQKYIFILDCERFVLVRTQALHQSTVTEDRLRKDQKMFGLLVHAGHENMHFYWSSGVNDARLTILYRYIC